MLNDTDPSNIAQEWVKQFADKYKPMLMLKEYNYLTKTKHKIPNLYMLLTLHQSKRINEIIKKQKSCPIVAGSVYHTSGIWEILHIIMESSLAMNSHIAKDYFDFKNGLDKHCPIRNTLITCDIKSLYTNIWHDLFYTAIEYWVEKLQNDLPILRRFNK